MAKRVPSTVSLIALATWSSVTLPWMACSHRLSSSPPAALLEETVAAASGGEEFINAGAAAQVVASRSDTREYIDAADGVRAAVSNIESQAGPIAVDCEGIDFGRRGRMTLIQVAVTGYAAIFDVQTIGGDILFCDGCDLGDLLRDPDRVKVFFDCRHDVDVLDKHFGLRVEGILDLQIADVILRGDDLDGQLKRLKGPIHPGSIRGSPQMYINVVKLRALGEVMKEYDLPDQGKLTDAEHGLWGNRPLTAELKEYAFNDAVGIRNLFEQMEKRTEHQESYDEIRDASTRFADSFRALGNLPDKRYLEHPFLPLCIVKDVPEVPCNSGTVICPACKRELPRSIFSRNKQRSNNFRCDVCRAIDIQQSVQGSFRRNNDWDGLTDADFDYD